MLTLALVAIACFSAGFMAGCGWVYHQMNRKEWKAVQERRQAALRPISRS